jgi:hypothetical protein
MSEEEMSNLWSKYLNEFISPVLTDIGHNIEKLRDEIRIEHEDLWKRAIDAETKLKLYEDLFKKLNLDLEIKNERS